MPVILLPSLLAAQSGGQNRFETNAADVTGALRELPVADLIFDESGVLRPLVNVYVDGVDIRERQGLDTSLAEAESVRVVAAIAGG